MKALYICLAILCFNTSALAAESKVLLKAQLRDCMTVYHNCYSFCSNKYTDAISTTKLTDEALECYSKCLPQGKRCTKLSKQIQELEKKEKIYP